MTTKLAVMQQIIAAWHKQDVEGVLAHVTDDIVWHYAAPALPPPAAVPHPRLAGAHPQRGAPQA